MTKSQEMGGNFHPIWADTAVQIIVWVHQLPTIKSIWPTWERSNICRGGKGSDRSSIISYIVVRAVAVMKDEGKGNFTIFQSVIHPEKARQIFCKKYSLFLCYIVMKINTSVPRPNFGRRHWKVVLLSGCSIDVFWKELMIKTEGL